jgi:hypothetical protein
MKLKIIQIDRETITLQQKLSTNIFCQVEKGVRNRVDDRVWAQIWQQTTAQVCDRVEINSI